MARSRSVRALRINASSFVDGATLQRASSRARFGRTTPCASSSYPMQCGSRASYTTYRNAEDSTGPPRSVQGTIHFFGCRTIDNEESVPKAPRAFARWGAGSASAPSARLLPLVLVFQGVLVFHVGLAIEALQASGAIIIRSELAHIKSPPAACRFRKPFGPEVVNAIVIRD